MPSPSKKIPSTTKPKIPRLALVLAALAVIIGLAWGGTVLYTALNKSTVNYAEEVVKPLEAALVKAGGTKQCTRGSDGRGIGNNQPNYEAVFETNLTKDEAVQSVTSLAKEYGYKLAYSRSPNEYMDKYFDGTSKESPYTDLSEGKIRLFVDFYDGGDSLGCFGDLTVKYDKDHTAVALTVSLPEFKR